jgi:lipopolysaccharide/colanic/teichoic acid biosynthesis glycosyltransferase
MSIRILDFCFAFISTILLFPLLFIIAILIVIDSKGGIFYSQVRVGQYNKDFKLLKFRTMNTGSDSKGLLTVGNRDPRVTKIGQFLRKYKLDELPQFINVFIGNMSIVGPRPEVRKYVDLYSEDQKRILLVKPGITDYASLSYMDENELLSKSNNPEQTYIQDILPVKIKLNYKYIDNKSIKEYFYIIFLTAKSIFLNRS